MDWVEINIEKETIQFAPILFLSVPVDGGSPTTN